MTLLSAVILRGTTAERPAVGLAGRLFYDTTLTKWQRDNGTVWQDCDLLSPQDLLHAEGHAFWGSDPIDIQDILNYGTRGQVPKSDGLRSFFMGTLVPSDIDGLHPQEHAADHGLYGPDELLVEDLANLGTRGQVPRSDGQRGFYMGGVAKSLLSGSFTIDSTGIKTVTTAHGLIDTFAAKDVVLTVIEDTNVD